MYLNQKINFLRCVGLLFTFLQFQLNDGSTFFDHYELVHPNQISIVRNQRDLHSTDHSKFLSVNVFNSTISLKVDKFYDATDARLFVAEVDKENSNLRSDINIDIFHGYVPGSKRRSFVYWENNLLVGHLHTPSGSFYIEPAWRHIKTGDRNSMIAYRSSDLKLDNKNILKMCKEAHAPDYNPEKFEQSRKKRQTGDGTRCPILLVADYTYFINVGGGSFSATVKYMIGVITRINDFYLSTEFSSQFSHLGMTVKGVIVHSSEGGVSYNLEKVWESNFFLQEFGRNVEANGFCLAHLFTYREFGSILGLAWLASERTQSLGGICSPCYSNICYNTAWSTSSLNGKKLPTMQADLVTAHEIGHGWGSSHDPDDCAPSTADGGKYLMYPYSVSGYNDNNNKFSSCSKKSIANVLKTKRTCFTGDSISFCGNGKVEAGEDCDGAGTNQTCCDTKCKLTQGSECSDANSECCTNCKFADISKLCRKPDLNSCDTDTYCTSVSASCPNPTTKNNGEDCGFMGKCYDTCKSYCELRSKKNCACDGANSCYLCCRDDANSTCEVSEQIMLPDNTPCYKGFCLKGVCNPLIANRNPRTWEIINHLKIDNLATFMRNNLVLSTIILSLIPYAIICFVIWFYDRKKLKKEKSTDCDSALIPLLCVHG